MNITRIFPFRSARIQRARTLASLAETYARVLSHLPLEHPDGASQDIITILESTCGMLENLVEQAEAFPGKPEPDTSFAAQQHTSTTPIAYQTPSDADVASHTGTPDTSSVTDDTPAPEMLADFPKETPAEPDPEPSATARELIRLRDWVLLARVGGTAVEPTVLEEIYGQLARVLAKEGITPFEESGSYDYNRQSVIGVQPTDDPAQDDKIYSTVKPGYLFQGKLVRPQEVIVYAYHYP